MTARLKTQEYVVGLADGTEYAPTPSGLDIFRTLIAHAELEPVATLGEPFVASEFGYAQHALIDPALAPRKWSVAVAEFLEQYEFDSNVFCMTRFPNPSAPDDLLHTVIDTLRDATHDHGLTLHLASDRQLDDDLFGNVVAHMWACRYGIAVFESVTGRGMNYNLVLEVGAMLATGRRCALLKDSSVSTMPTDLVGQIYKPVDLHDSGAISAVVHGWLRDDLNLGGCRKCAA